MIPSSCIGKLVLESGVALIVRFDSESGDELRGNPDLAASDVEFSARHLEALVSHAREVHLWIQSPFLPTKTSKAKITAA